MARARPISLNIEVKKKKKEKEDRSICERVIPFQLRDAVICYSMMSIETAQFPDPRFDAKL